MTSRQPRQVEWHHQWSMFSDEETSLFHDWIEPNRLSDFRGKDVLEAGCGGGHHTALIAGVAHFVTAVDLNTADLARRRNLDLDNAEFLEADISSMALARRFDVAISIGVLHHTDDPDAAVANLARHLRPGGRLILWVYSDEGNEIMKRVVEPLRRRLLTRLDRRWLRLLAQVVTATLYPIAHTVYRLPLSSLPYFQYMAGFRRLPFGRNTLNVFDKLNAPQTVFIQRERVERWLPPTEFVERHVSSYRGVSWRASGTKRRTGEEGTEY